MFLMINMILAQNSFFFLVQLTTLMRAWTSDYPSSMLRQCIRNIGEKPVAERKKKITLCVNLTTCISFYAHSDLQSVFCHNVIALHGVLEEISSHRTVFLFIFFCGKENCWPDFSNSVKRKTWGRREEVSQTFLTVIPRLNAEE